MSADTLPNCSFLSLAKIIDALLLENNQDTNQIPITSLQLPTIYLYNFETD